MILFLGLTALAFSGEISGNKNVIIYLIGFIAFFAFSQGAVIWVLYQKYFQTASAHKVVPLEVSLTGLLPAIIFMDLSIIVEGSSKGGMYSFLFYAVMMFLHLLFVWKFCRKRRVVHWKIFKKTWESNEGKKFSQVLARNARGQRENDYTHSNTNVSHPCISRRGGRGAEGV
jgi:hypothetical protein